MDPITQGVLGAIAPQSVAGKQSLRWASLIGFLAGLLADVDVFITSAEDPLLAIQYHRHFTHSLAFIPVGGLVAAAVLWLFLRKRMAFKSIYLFATLGYATHALLDACTSYGTMLLWPFSTARIAWDNVAVIDPIYTGILIVGMILSLRRKRNRPAVIAFVLSVCYLLFGVVQRERAEGVIERYAATQGATPTRYEVKPSFGNLIVWRTIYEHNGYYHVNAVRVGLFGGALLYPGDSVQAFVPHAVYPTLDTASILHNDIRRFTFFSDGMVALHPTRPGVLGDVRYAMLPNGVSPLWGITLDTTRQNGHTPFEQYSVIEDGALGTFWGMIIGDGGVPVE